MARKRFEGRELKPTVARGGRFMGMQTRATLGVALRDDCPGGDAGADDSNAGVRGRHRRQ